MGFFGGDETIYVSSVIYPMGPAPDEVPDVMVANVIAASVRKQNVAKAIDDTIIKGMGVKLGQAYNYASNKYYGGLPTGLPAVGTEPGEALLETLVKEYLETLYPLATTIEVPAVYMTFGSNYDTIVRQQIEVDWNYDFYTDACHTATGAVDVDAQLVYAQLPLDPDLHPGEIGYVLIFTNPDTTEETYEEWYAESLFNTEDRVKQRIVMSVILDGDPSFTLSYEYGQGDVRLDLFLRRRETPQSGTYPAITLKKRKQAYLNENEFTGGDWKTSNEYRTSKGYARRLGLDLDQVLASVAGNAQEEEIDYAFIQPGTLINATNQAPLEYHWNYFNRLRLSFPSNQTAYDAWVTAYGSTTLEGAKTVSSAKAEGCPTQYVHFKDPDDDEAKNTINMAIGWRYITYQEVSGTLTSGNTYEVECGAEERQWVKYRFGRATRILHYDETKLTFRKQLNPSTYAEILVCGLMHENYVYKGEKVKSSAYAAFNLPESDQGTGFIIPLDYEIFVSLSPRNRLQLAQEALHMVFNCVVIVKEKWYQTGFFQMIVIIVSVVLIVYSWGAATPYVTALNGSLAASLIAAGISVTLAYALAAIITAIIIVGLAVGVNYVAKEAGEWAAEKWGPAWGAVVQIGVAIALSWGIGYGMNAYSGTATTAPTSIGLTEQVLNAASFVIVGFSSFTEYQMQELQLKKSEWDDYIGSPDNPLEEVERLLKEMFPEYTWLQQALTMPRENLDEFLGRTLSLTDTLTNRLFLPISHMTDLTLTPKLT